MSRQTPLYDAHLQAGGRMVEFAGWSLPIHYGSVVDEHHAVRRSVGLFDVSHMTVIDLQGEQTEAFLRWLLANDVAKLKQPGSALYSCMLDESGGILDDLIVYRLDREFYRLVVNAATRASDLEWIGARAEGRSIRIDERDDLAMLAVQGPEAERHLIEAFNAPVLASLKPFKATMHGDLFIARTGYTGEDGFEVLLHGDEAAGVWQLLLDRGVTPCGLGARDTLRLEAGLNLYGQDMDRSTTPLESNLGWTVAFEPADRDFIGRAALERQRAEGVRRQLVGLISDGRGIPRHGAVVRTDVGEGVVTSGGFGPTVGRPIAMARIPAGVTGTVEVELRGRALPARIVRLPFVRRGECLVDQAQ